MWIQQTFGDEVLASLQPSTFDVTSFEVEDFEKLTERIIDVSTLHLIPVPLHGGACFAKQLCIAGTRRLIAKPVAFA